MNEIVLKPLRKEDSSIKTLTLVEKNRYEKWLKNQLCSKLAQISNWETLKSTLVQTQTWENATIWFSIMRESEWGHRYHDY